MRSCDDGHALRTVSSAVAVVCLALVFHAAAGGRVPTAPAVGLLTLATLAVTAPLTRRRTVPLPGLLAVLGGAQVMLHAAFDAHGHAAGHVHAVAHGAASTATMVAMHAVATLLTSLAFAQGRDALRTATAWSAVRHLLLHPPRLLPAPPRLPVLLAPPSATTSVLPGAVRSRAPPVLVPYAS